MRNPKESGFSEPLWGACGEAECAAFWGSREKPSRFCACDPGARAANLAHELLDISMRAVIQRVTEAAVVVGGREVSRIGAGLLVLLGVEEGDRAADVEWLAGKVVKMRLFADGEGKMNRSVGESGGRLLVVSQFTLHASTQKGNRPSFIRAAGAAVSEPLYEAFCAALEGHGGQPVGRGIFGAEMKISLVNDGPVTIVIDSRCRE
jgi:D-tyrosyl-tRNA(Tyr) deacylase